MCRHSTALAKIFWKTKICRLDPTQPTWWLKFVTQPDPTQHNLWMEPTHLHLCGRLCMHWNTDSDRSIYRMQLKLSTQGFLAIFFQGLVIFKQNFTRLSYAQLLNFIQSSLPLTKLCRIKCDHLVNFYISLAKREKLRYLCNTTTDLHKIWHNDAEPVSQVRRPLKMSF